MTARTAERKPRPAPATCARCGHRNLHSPAVTPLGLVGPECEHHVHEALAHLQRNGLGQLALTGELRLAAVRGLDGAFHAPSGLQQHLVLAERVGLQLNARFDPPAREFVLTLSPASVRALLNRQPHAAVQA